jgi:hypothetical protein
MSCRCVSVPEATTGPGADHRASGYAVVKPQGIRLSPIDPPPSLTATIDLPESLSARGAQFASSRIVAESPADAGGSLVKKASKQLKKHPERLRCSP